MFVVSTYLDFFRCVVLRIPATICQPIVAVIVAVAVALVVAVAVWRWLCLAAGVLVGLFDRIRKTLMWPRGVHGTPVRPYPVFFSLKEKKSSLKEETSDSERITGRAGPVYSSFISYDFMLCYVMLCHVMLCYVVSCYVRLCYVVSGYVMLCCVMLCYVVSCYVRLCYVVPCYVMLCCVMLCHVVSCCVTSLHRKKPGVNSTPGFFR